MIARYFRTKKPEKVFELEARINSGDADACGLCGRTGERISGATEAYIPGTKTWVCPGCAFNTDRELATFAYRLERYKRPRMPKDDYHYGLCPACGRRPRWLNVETWQWAFCERHGLRWPLGENVTGSWQRETESDWKRNVAVLRRCRATEAYYWSRPVKTWFSWSGRSLEIGISLNAALSGLINRILGLEPRFDVESTDEIPL